MSAEFDYINKVETYFRGKGLNGKSFRHAILSGADFTGADLIGANFHSATLTNASFRDTQLDGAIFTDANLQGVDFTDAQLGGASFANAIWDGLAVQGLPDSDVYLVPTPGGWLVTDGCGDWGMDLDEFRTAVNGYNRWSCDFPPRLVAEDQYKALVTLFDAHVEQHPFTIINLRKKWSNN